MQSDYVPELNLEGSPTIWRYMMSKAQVRIIMGPVGSGKSVGSCSEIMRLAMEQEPSPPWPLDRRDCAWQPGVRYVKAGVVRNTYGELKSTTLETWTDIFPEARCGPVVHSAPIEHHIKIPGELDLQVLFVSADRPKDVRKLLSLELTFLWFNEVREIEASVFRAASDRIGRYPSMKHHGVFATRDCIIGDTNPPDEDHWLYELENEAPENHEFFHQPPAVLKLDQKPPEVDFEYESRDLITAAGHQYIINPKAENLKNLKPGYYPSKLPGKTEAWIDVYYRSKYGVLEDGTPVIKRYTENLMMVPDLQVLPDRELLIGIDLGGGTLAPAAVIGQRHVNGAWLIHAEVVATDMGIDEFARQIKLTLDEIFEGRQIDRGWGDPAGNNRDEIYEVAVMQHMRDRGIPIYAAPTNNEQSRIDAIGAPMTRLIMGKPGFLIHRRCKVLRAGLGGKWRYKRLQVSGTDRYANKPEKNRWSHPCDGLGYLLSGGGEYRQLQGRGKHKTGLYSKPINGFKRFNPVTR